MRALIERMFGGFSYKVQIRNNYKFNNVMKGTLEWVTVEKGSLSPEDAGFTIDEEDAGDLARALYQAAIEAGLLPDQSKLQGELEATKRHLADLQKAFNKLVEKV